MVKLDDEFMISIREYDYVIHGGWMVKNSYRTKTMVIDGNEACLAFIVDNCVWAYYVNVEKKKNTIHFAVLDYNTLVREISLRRRIIPLQKNEEMFILRSTAILLFTHFGLNMKKKYSWDVEK